MFSVLLERVRSEITRVVMSIRVRDSEEVAQAEAALEEAAELGELTLQHGDKPSASSIPQIQSVFQPTIPQDLFDNIGRNDPCPCGSGKKFKVCHGKLA
jgi:preprotein translocase subunit SecA